MVIFLDLEDDYFFLIIITIIINNTIIIRPCSKPTSHHRPRRWFDDTSVKREELDLLVSSSDYIVFIPFVEIHGFATGTEFPTRELKQTCYHRLTRRDQSRPYVERVPVSLMPMQVVLSSRKFGRHSFLLRRLSKMESPTKTF